MRECFKELTMLFFLLTIEKALTYEKAIFEACLNQKSNKIKLAFRI